MRAVARDVGLTSRALNLFLSGSKPRLSTQAKLRAWFVRDAAAMPEHDADTVRAALNVLSALVPEGVRGELHRALLERIEAAHRDAGLRPPAWLNEMWE